MFIRVHSVHVSGIGVYSPGSDMVINTSQIAKIDVYNSSPDFEKTEYKKQYSKMFDTDVLGIFDVTLSTGRNHLIIGPKKAYDNIK